MYDPEGLQHNVENDINMTILIKVQFRVLFKKNLVVYYYQKYYFFYSSFLEIFIEYREMKVSPSVILLLFIKHFRRKRKLFRRCIHPLKALLCIINEWTQVR